MAAPLSVQTLSTTASVPQLAMDLELLLITTSEYLVVMTLAAKTTSLQVPAELREVDAEIAWAPLCPGYIIY
jgi:hypothetical protein